MIREGIKNLIEKSMKELQKGKVFPEFKILEIQVEYPEEKTHGDYATNVAMVIAKQIKKNPLEIAENLKSEILGPQPKAGRMWWVGCSLKSGLFDKVEVAKPGFINFFLSKEYLQKQVKEILKQGEKFGQLKIGKGEKVQVEFISANPTGPLHIGNGRGAFFGDTLANVLEKAGYKVEREYYINDAKVNTQIKTLGKTALGKGITYLNDYLKSKILNLKSKLERISKEGEAGYLLAQEVQKDTKDFIEKKLKIKFDNWVSEEDLYKKNKVEKIYNWLKKQNLIYKKEGAEWIKTSQFGDYQDWVIIRETGEPTYLLSDITYHKDKFDRRFDKIINIWGADHQGHISKIKAAAKMLGYKGNLDILISQVVRLKGGLKLSKRKGQIITLEDLINEIGLDAARFFYLTKSLDTQMEFDIDLAKEQSEKNPVYYVQYAHTRICGILRKLKTKNEKLKMTTKNLKLLNHPSELELIKQLIRFPEVVEDTAKDYQVQRLPQYAIDLATVFHQFYRDCKVLTDYNPPATLPPSAGPSTRSLSEARLGLILATKTVFKNTLNLIGVSAPEKM